VDLLRHAEQFGAGAGPVAVEMGTVRQRKRDMVDGLIGAHLDHYKQHAAELVMGRSPTIEEQIRANELDLGVVGGHGLVPGEECLAAGLVDELVLIVWPGHPWARRREILSADLESTSSTVPVCAQGRLRVTEILAPAPAHSLRVPRPGHLVSTRSANAPSALTPGHKAGRLPSCRGWRCPARDCHLGAPCVA
jgi:DNA-binding transcriptional LysR family regulator